MQDETNETENQAAMEAAFLATTEGEVTEVPQAPEVLTEKPAVETPPATPEAPPVETQTADQTALQVAIQALEKRLTQQVDKVSVNYGEVKRQLEAAKKAAATPEGAADADEVWADLRNEFPELSAPVAKGVDVAVRRHLQHALAAMPNTSPESIEAVIAARETRLRQESTTEDIKLLTKIHPDHKEIFKSPEWSQWLATLPEVRRQKTIATTDLEYVCDRVDEFKQYRIARAKEQAKNKNRIEAAVTPQGARQSGRTNLSEEEEMHKAFLEASTN